MILNAWGNYLDHIMTEYHWKRGGVARKEETDTRKPNLKVKGSNGRTVKL